MLIIRLFSVLSLLTLVACGPSENQTSQTPQNTKVYRWDMVTTWPRDLPGLGSAANKLSKMLDTMSQGRLKIKVHGAGEIVPAFEVFDAVSGGNVAQMGHGAAYYWRGKTKAAAFFTAVPFGLTAQEMNGWLHYGGGLELWRELYQPFNLIPFPSGNTGVQMAGWFNKEINSLADIKGLKMRIPGLGGEVFKRAGGEPVTLPGGEIFTALETGVIDATEWVGPYNDLTFGLHQVAEYYYYPGWQEPGPTLETIVNKQAWDSLPADLQEMITVATRAVNEDMLDEYTYYNSAYLQQLVDKHGVKLRRLPDDVLAKLKQVSDDIIAEEGSSDELAQRIYASYIGYRDQVKQYHKISEKAYINAR